MGIEVSICVAAAELIRVQGHKVQVVSIPSLETFQSQPAEYRNEVLPLGVPSLIVGAAHPQPWGCLAGYPGGVIGMTTFDESSKPQDFVNHLGFTAGAVAQELGLILGSASVSAQN